MARQKIEVWVDEEDLARIDQVRGLAARSAWAREILHDAVSDDRPHHGVPSTTIETDGRTIRGTGLRAREIPHDTKHRHRYEKTGDTRPKGNGRGVEHEMVCGGCGDTKWEGR